MNESRCSQPERDMGRNVKWLQSYFLGNGSPYEKPTVSSIYMGWMADWVQVEEWDLAARQGTPLSSPAIHFHYNTPLKPPAHNHTYSLMQGGGLLRVATIYKNNQRCKSLTIWFMLMWLHFHCCPWVPFFICCAASVAFFVETTFHLQMLKLMNSLCQVLSAFSIGKMLKTLYGCHTSCPIRMCSALCISFQVEIWSIDCSHLGLKPPPPIKTAIPAPHLLSKCWCSKAGREKKAKEAGESRQRGVQEKTTDVSEETNYL